MILRKATRYLATAALVTLIYGFSKGDVAQEYLPTPPADHSLVYFLNANNELTPLPYEPGRTSLDPTRPAKQTRVAFIELRGEHAATAIETDRPRIFLFTSQRAGSHPPFLVSLTARHESRRVTAVAQQGLTGYAIASEQIIKPNIRVLATEGQEVFMEIRPRGSLTAGEYAIIGDDLGRIATFRVPPAQP